jgi:hypothetical protein
MAGLGAGAGIGILPSPLICGGALGVAAGAAVGAADADAGVELEQPPMNKVVAKAAVEARARVREMIIRNSP